MALIAREAIAPAVLPQEEVAAPEIGGDVLVRGLDLPQFQRFAAAQRRAAQPQPGETEQDAQERAAGEVMPLLLHLCVLAGDEEPVYSPAQWAAFARQHMARAVDLLERATRLSGLGDEKKA